MWREPDREGTLKKQGHIVPNWKQRWFILKNTNLFYFKKKGESKPLGEIPLEGSAVRKMENKELKRSYCFELFSPTIQKTFYIQCNNDEELNTWMKDIQCGSSIIVGTPSNVKHHVHVDFNSETGFEGLPAEWQTWLINSRIEKKDIIENASTMLEVLQQYGQIKEGHTPKPAGREDSPVLPKSETSISLKDLCSDPSNKDLYEVQDIIGEGAAGEVFIGVSKERQNPVAIKKMTINPDNLKLLCTEISIMKSSRHPNIVEFFGLLCGRK